jgi:CBS domain-containing protein
MHRGVISCAPDTALRDVARIMAEHHVHCVVVEESGAHAAERWSVVSDVDLVTAAVADRLEEPVAATIAGTWVPRIGAHEPLVRAAQLMAEHDVSHLVVVGEASGRPRASSRRSMSPRF